MADTPPADGPPVPRIIPPHSIDPADEFPPVVKNPPSGEAPRHVVLTREGHYFVATDLVDKLARKLGVPILENVGPHRRRKNEFGSDPDLALRHLWEDTLRHPHIRALAGLEADAMEFLELRGYRVVLDGDRPAVWPELNATRFRRAGAGYGDFLELLRVYDRGLVRYDPARVDACELVAAAAIAWPEKATIVVVAGDRAEALMATRRLGELGVELRPEGAASGPGIAVSTQDDLFGDRMRIRARTLLFFLEPEFRHDSPFGLDVLLAAPRARAFGLLPTDRQVPQDAEKRMLDLFGKRGLRVPEPVTTQEAGLRRHE